MTRWNAKYLMLERFNKLLPFATKVLRDSGHNAAVLTTGEIKEVDAYLDVLRPCFQTTTWLEGQKYATLSALYPLLHRLYNKLISDVNFQVFFFLQRPILLRILKSILGIFHRQPKPLNQRN